MARQAQSKNCNARGCSFVFAFSSKERGASLYQAAKAERAPAASSWSVQISARQIGRPTRRAAVSSRSSNSAAAGPRPTSRCFSRTLICPRRNHRCSVDGTTNSHCNPQNDADAEVALDIQVAGAAYAVATGKPANIRVYWSQDITKAIVAATADGCDVCSISWGADEASWGAAAGTRSSRLRPRPLRPE